METISLDYFIEIGKELNISKAAYNCHVTQQSLSAYVQKLESFFGVHLLERKPRLRLTAAGELVLKAATDIEKIYERLFDELAKCDTNQQLSLTIGVHIPITSLINRLPLAELAVKYPKMSVNIVTGYYRDLLQMLKNKEIDMMLHIGSAKRQPQEITAEYISNLVFEDQKCIAISDTLLKAYFPARYPACVKEFEQGVSLLDFAEMPIVLHPSRTDVIIQMKKFIKKNHKKLNVVAEGATPEIANTFVSNGLAIGISSVKMAHMEFEKQPNIHFFPILDEEVRHHDIVLVSRNEAERPGAQQYLENWIVRNWGGISEDTEAQLM